MKKEYGLLKPLTSLGRKLQVLMVDDEKVYRNSLLQLVSSLKEINPFIEIHEANGSNEATGITTEKMPDLAIIDVDLSEENMNGFDVVKKLRKDGMAGPVCIHSNRNFVDCSNSALEAGADAFFPKPMGKLHLLGLLEGAVRKISSLEALQAPKAKKDQAIILDDTPMYLRNWEHLKDVDTTLFRSPEAFWKDYRKREFAISDIDWIVTDFHFDGSKDNGISFARRCRKMRIEVPIFLASDTNFTSAELEGTGIDAQVPKIAL